MELAGLSFLGLGANADGRMGFYDEQWEEYAADLAVDRDRAGNCNVCDGCDI